MKLELIILNLKAGYAEHGNVDVDYILCTDNMVRMIQSDSDMGDEK